MVAQSVISVCMRASLEAALSAVLRRAMSILVEPIASPCATV
jgi:hypothetical protein